MFSSLKSRLWLTYTLLIVLLLSSVGIGILLTLRNNPVLYRQPVTQLESVIDRTINLISRTPDIRDMKSVLFDQSHLTNTRLALFHADGTLEFDSEPPPGAQLQLSIPLIPSIPGEVRFVNDLRDRGWVYTVKPVNDKLFLMAAIKKPRLPLSLLLRDELFTPLVRAGMLAMLLAVALAIFLGNWVEAPLLKLAGQATAVTRGGAKPVSLEGPTEVKQLLGTFNDMVTKLNASQQSQRDFIANVSHELKTPLTSIQGFAQAILDQVNVSEEETQQSAKIILNEAQRMNRLVMDLLTLARLDAGNTGSRKGDVDLAAVLHNVLERLTPQAQQAAVTLVDQINPVPGIQADVESLSQVFANLIDNAIKFSSRGGKVTVSCRAKGGEIEVHVVDSGVGIAKQDQARIFERFYQIDKSRRGGVKRGVGLGLAIANQLITSMGGSIAVQSDQGAGSDFMVKLPIV